MTYYEIILRSSIAIMVGAFIGFERSKKRKPAGFTTHTIVCLGACVIAMIQVMISENEVKRALLHPELISMFGSDSGRLIAQVVSGIGFLGAGTIIQTKDIVTGITTAATLWLVACFGIGIGSGYYYMVILVMSILIVSLFFMKKIQVYFIDKNKIRKLIVTSNSKEDIDAIVKDILMTNNIKISKIDNVSEERINDKIEKKSIYTIMIPRYIKTSDLIERINAEKSVAKIKLKAKFFV